MDYRSYFYWTAGMLVSVSAALVILSVKFVRFRRRCLKLQTGQTIEKQFKPEDSNNEMDEHRLKILARIRHHIFLEEGFRDPELSLTRLCIHTGVGRTHLSYLINEVTGKNFNQWINEIRIREALVHMAETRKKYTLAAIAYDVGFQDRNTFFRAFKKICGVSPSEFSRELAES